MATLTTTFPETGFSRLWLMPKEKKGAFRAPQVGLFRVSLAQHLSMRGVPADGRT